MNAQLEPRVRPRRPCRRCEVLYPEQLEELDDPRDVVLAVAIGLVGIAWVLAVVAGLAWCAVWLDLGLEGVL